MSRSDLSDSLRAVSIDGGIILLDLNADRVLKLNTVASDIWTMLTQGRDLGEIASSLAEKYRVEPERVSRDIDLFSERLKELSIKPIKVDQVGFALPDGSRKSQSYPWYGGNKNQKDWEPSPPMLVLAAILGLLGFDLILAVLSFKTLCAAVKAWPIRRRCINNRTVAQVCSAVEEACVWYPKRTVCLQRSAIATCLLRTRGVRARMIIGVKAMPLLAHAWVEADGAVVNDWPKVQTFYTPVLSL